MQVTPRKLRLLIIDDELTTAPQGYVVPDSIERWSPYEKIIGIDSLQTSMQFWTHFQGGEAPDLVVADVRFIQDRTTPLSKLSPPDKNNIPTGLLHLGPFAVLSRVMNLPIGVAVRTMDPKLWKNQMASIKLEEQAMALLAVHLIAEIAPILGDNELTNVEIESPDFIDGCLRWLHDTSAKEFEDGLRKAIQNYRYRLLKLLKSPQKTNVVIPSSSYAKLLNWCSKMQMNPAPLDYQNDVGLELTYDDGKRDFISIASLFSDFDGIRSKLLEPSSFVQDGDPIDEPWKLDDDGRPRIGAFLKQLGSLYEAYSDAAEAVKAYTVSYPPPDNYKPPTLAPVKSREGHSALIAGLTVIFQFMHIEQKKVEQWEHSFKNDSWDPKNLRFVSGMPQPTDNLKTALDKLIKLIQKYVRQIGLEEDEDRFFTRADLFDYFPVDFQNYWVRKVQASKGGQDAEWMRWHFERLVDVQVLEYRKRSGDDYYALNPDWEHGRSLTEIPPAPRSFPPVIGHPDSEYTIQREPSRVQWLRVSLGFGNKNFNSLERILADAFAPTLINDINSTKARAAKRARTGRAILHSFDEPDLSPFFLGICRDYAKRLNWAEEKWPKWLHERVTFQGH